MLRSGEARPARGVERVEQDRVEVRLGQVDEHRVRVVERRRGRFGQGIIFLASVGIILFLPWRPARELPPGARATLGAPAVIIFVSPAMPRTRPGRPLPPRNCQ